MKVTEHTPQGVSQRELTPQELEQWAADGDPRARLEVARNDLTAHTDPHKKIDLLAWVIGVLDTKPTTTPSP